MRVAVITLFFLLLSGSLWLSFHSKLNVVKELTKIEKRLNGLIKENKKKIYNGPLHFYFKISNKTTIESLRILPGFSFQNKSKHFPSLIENNSGIYVVDLSRQNDTLEIFLTKIYSHFPIRNQYFQNEAHPQLHSPYKVTLSLEKGNHIIALNNAKIYVDFEIDFDAHKSLLAWILWLAAAVLLLWIAHLNRNLRVMGLILSFIMILTLLGHLLPRGYYENILYDVLYFSSDIHYLKYSGDVLCMVTILITGGFWYRMILENSVRTFLKITLSSAVYLISYGITAFYIKTNENLIRPDHFSDFDPMIFIILFALWTAQAIWLWNLWTALKALKNRIFYITSFLIISLILCMSHSVWNNENLFFSLLYAFGIVVSGLLFMRGNSWIGFAGIFLFASWTVTDLIVPNNYVKSVRLMEEFAFQKLNERDYALEGEFLDIPERLSNNASIQNLMAFSPQEELTELLKKNIFYGYFRKYEIQFSLFDKNCLPEWKTEFLLMRNLDALKELFQTRSEPTLSDYLRLVRWPDGNKYYLSLLPLKDKTLACLFIPLPVGEAGTVLDLFSDMGASQILKKSSAEFAIYKNGILSENSGLNELPAILPAQLPPELKSIKSDRQTLVARLPAKDAAQYLKIFFLILITHGILMSVLMLSGLGLFSGKGILSLKFREKLLLFFILSISLILAVIFVFIRKNIEKEFKEQHFAYLKEKISVLKKVTSDLIENEFDFNIIKDPLDFILKKFSYENGIDVVYYDQEGVQQLTSLEKLNDFGVRTNLLPDNLILPLSGGLDLYQNEFAGKMNYYCAYTPLIMRNGKIAGFLALPYFPSKSELFRRQDQLINGLVNLLLILFLPAFGLSAFLASYIVRPLQILSSRLVSNKAVWENEKLEWKSEDEIGTLVNAYNQMLEKLKENITKLSVQERESAWREMARQIAHEIKNPLTPIRLNIQHLMYLFKKSPAQFEEKFSKTSEAILQQIDALTAIANEFSHFAKISNEPFENIDLIECIRSVIMLYESTPGLKITMETPPSMPVTGNKNQIISVLNNLFENAREALTGKADAEITLKGHITENNVILLINDNGPGIPNEIRQKLFTPYFTTKSSGTGLGLAIVKRIMQHHGGDIILEESENGGACFKLMFPLKENN
jgi:signal transduction histidine kinase